MTRYIIRPAGISTTPNIFKSVLNAQRTVKYPGSSRRVLHREHDFFLAYPPLECLGDTYATPESRNNYQRSHDFYTSNKPRQRNILRALGFPVPRTVTGDQQDNQQDHWERQSTYIVRPLRHSGGREYRLLYRNSGAFTTETGETYTPNSETEYVQELYPKNHEYRILIVKGTPLITLLKRISPDVSNTQPWNHAQGASFVTVRNPENNRLRHTNVYDLIHQNHQFFSGIDLCGLDILVNLQHTEPYVICEANLCPSVTIPDNLERIKQHVNSLRSNVPR